MKMFKLLAVGLIAAAVCIMCFSGCSNIENEPEGIGSADTAEEGEETVGEVAGDSEETPEAAPETVPEESVNNTEAEVITEAVTDEQTETSVIIETTTSNEVTEASAPVQTGSPEEAGETAEAVARLAEAQSGAKFNMGCADPVNGFDNSGLVYYVLTQNGISCPRTTGAIAEIGTKVDYDGLQRGDIVVCQMNNSGKADFVGICIGGGKAVFATSEERPVTVTDITTAWYRNAVLYGCAVAR